MDWGLLNGSRIVGLELDEAYGAWMLRVRMGCSCLFDARTPTNGRHAHTCYEVCLATAGAGEFIHGEETLPLRAGDLFVADPHVAHEIRLSPARTPYRDASLTLFFFQVRLDTATREGHCWEQRALDDYLRGHRIISHDQQRLACYLDFFAHYRPLGDRHWYGLQQAAKSFVLECLAALAETPPAGTTRQAYPPPLELAVQYILEHYARKLTLAEIASAACTSPRNLQHLFHHYLGATVIGYLNARRMSMAASRLRMNYSISDTAEWVGVPDPARFSRLFRRHHRLSPKQYQQRHAHGGIPFGTACDCGES